MYRALGTENNADAAAASYHNIIHFDQKFCPTKVLNAINERKITLDPMDKDGSVMRAEAAYLDLDKNCWNTKRGLYLQVHRDGKNSSDSKLDTLNGKKTRDMYYAVINGVSPSKLAELEVTKEEVETCLSKAMFHRFGDTGPKDLTKCFHYTQCKDKEIDWGTPAGNELPADYNDDDYTFACDEDASRCTVTLSDGTSFTGRLLASNQVVQFRSIRYAQPPVGDLRWKAPVLNYDFADPVDATEYLPSCATFNPANAEPDFSEDCLSLNLSVPRAALENKEKKPIVMYIHGGGHNNGNNQGTNEQAVQFHDVVWASVAYRLGPYGFLALNEKEADQDWMSHWAYQDQIAAMKFLHMFGAVFGGDKDNITLTGGSAGSEAAWRHLTTEVSWPWFAKTAPAGAPMVAGSKTAGKKTQKLVAKFFEQAGCELNDMACMRALTHLEASTAAKNAQSAVSNDNVAMVFNGAFGPVHNSDWFRSSLFQDVHDGFIRPNTPVMWTWARDEPWGVADKFFSNQMTKNGGIMESMKTEIQEAIATTGFSHPAPYLKEFFKVVFGEAFAFDLDNAFYCADGDCKQALNDFIMATQWVCIARRAWANSGQDFDSLVTAMSFEEPTCAKVDGVNTHTCHGNDSGWWKANNLGKGDFAVAMAQAYKDFYHSGSGTDGVVSKIGSGDVYSQVYNKLSAESFDGTKFATATFSSGPFYCDLLDHVHDSFNWYNWGITEMDDDSLIENTRD